MTDQFKAQRDHALALVDTWRDLHDTAAAQAAKASEQVDRMIAIVRKTDEANARLLALVDDANKTALKWRGLAERLWDALRTLLVAVEGDHTVDLLAAREALASLLCEGCAERVRRGEYTECNCGGGND